jgi:hypothetical protein
MRLHNWPDHIGVGSRRSDGIASVPTCAVLISGMALLRLEEAALHPESIFQRGAIIPSKNLGEAPANPMSITRQKIAALREGGAAPRQRREENRMLEPVIVRSDTTRVHLRAAVALQAAPANGRPFVVRGRNSPRAVPPAANSPFMDDKTRRHTAVQNCFARAPLRGTLERQWVAEYCSELR